MTGGVGSLRLPAYDASLVTPGIAHIGPGAFHRAHQAVYVDDLLAAGHREWALCGIGLLPGDRRLHDALPRQDHRYTVVTKHGDGRIEGRVIGSLVRHLYAPGDPAAVLSQLSDPAIRIVTLTITEGGYDLDSAAPESFAYLVEALRRRRDAGIAPFTVLSCDNVESNGSVARAALAGWADRADASLGAWIREEVAFPSSMVDRITPATGDADRDLVRETWGIDDDVPVVSEAFRQWVVEDAFPTGRPPWEEVGVQVVPDVRPYELVKLRLLNGGHQALAYAGALLGHTYVHEAAADPAASALLRRYLGEAATALDPVPGLDVIAYQGQLQERFANPYVRDTLARICAYSSDRIPRFVLPVVERRRDAGRASPACAAVVATWACYLRGSDEQGRSHVVVDARRAELPSGLALLDHPLLASVGRDPAFREAVASWLKRFETIGIRAALAAP